MLLLIHKPELIQKVLMSSSCLEKWNFFYGLMERDYGLIAAKCKYLLHINSFYRT